MATSQIVKGTFIERIKRTPTVESFRFVTKERIDFLPGQFLQVMFNPQNQQDEELNKYLSFSRSALRQYFEVTKRLSESAFSERLKNLKKQDEVFFKAPLGSCVFKDEYKKIAFLIGGIGITPVISIIEYIMDKKLDTDVALFYSNKTEEEIAFKGELDTWESANHNIKVCYTVTDCQPSDKRCVHGRIEEDLLCNRMSDMRERIIFIFGPPKMVDAMKQLCLDMGARNEVIKTESFLGY